LIAKITDCWSSHDTIFRRHDKIRVVPKAE